MDNFKIVIKRKIIQSNTIANRNNKLIQIYLILYKSNTNTHSERDSHIYTLKCIQLNSNRK